MLMYSPTLNATSKITLNGINTVVVSVHEKILLPDALVPGGRVAVLTFHSGEDRRVKRAFRDGLRAGVYAAIAKDVIRSSKEETYSNRRAQAAKLRWAVRAQAL